MLGVTYSIASITRMTCLSQLSDMLLVNHSAKSLENYMIQFMVGYNGQSTDSFHDPCVYGGLAIYELDVCGLTQAPA